MILDRYTLSAASLAFALASVAQSPITLVAPGNVPVNGTSFLVQRGAYIAPPAGGADVLFNFSAVTSASSALNQWQDPALLPNTATFTGAQYALTNGGPDTIYYKATTAGLERVGDAVTITALGSSYHGITSYGNTILELPLPYTFGTAPWTDLFTGSYTVDGNTTTRNGAINGSADAWGRLIMPGGADTVEVLRMATHLTETIPLVTSLGNVSVNHVQHVTAFYPLWGKFPVLRIVSDTLSAMGFVQPNSYTEWLDASAVGVAEPAAQPLAMEAFPNPAAASATLLVNNPGKGAITLEIFDLRGAVVLQERFGGNSKQIEVANWEPGVYRVVLTNGAGQRSTASLVVAH
ncbi:MAG: T9SS type A sorting domain-containing protein [Bacteroidetes bacterium]|nr:T9SS type A sorting domain-containing protein [Bacteroidota bacterium]